MSWWQALLVWFAVACLLAPLVGAWLGAVARHYPVAEEER